MKCGEDNQTLITLERFTRKSEGGGRGVGCGGRKKGKAVEEDGEGGEKEEGEEGSAGKGVE